MRCRPGFLQVSKHNQGVSIDAIGPLERGGKAANLTELQVLPKTYGALALVKQGLGGISFAHSFRVKYDRPLA